ncbi:MAG: hypothetical protein KGJ60_16310 [Verrucomicrobiota bacterium]|nr:hypothetical protein [Verrucomicrobiota bacterium]
MTAWNGGGASGITIDSDGEYSRSLSYPYIQGAVIRDNLAENVAVGGPGQPAFFNAYTASSAILLHNRAENLPNATGIYRDTWNGTNVLIEGNVMDNVKYCIRFVMLHYHLNGVIIKNNVLRPAEHGFGIAYFTDASKFNLGKYDTNAFITNLVIAGNVVYPSASAKDTTALSIDGHASVSIVNNVLQGSGSGADLLVNYSIRTSAGGLYPRGLKLNSWSGNVRLDGGEFVTTNRIFR